MTRWLALPGRRASATVCEGIGLMVAASEGRIDLAVEFLLDDPTAAGGSLEFGRNAQVLGAPRPEPANALDADAGGTTDVLDIGKALQCLE
jgi:hypothetical protein